VDCGQRSGIDPVADGLRFSFNSSATSTTIRNSSTGGRHLSRIEAKPERPSGVDEDICSCRLTEHDPERPWIVLSQDHRTVTLDDDVTFFEWAHEQWPSPRWTVELDPWQIAPAWP